MTKVNKGLTVDSGILGIEEKGSVGSFCGGTNDCGDDSGGSANGAIY